METTDLGVHLRALRESRRLTLRNVQSQTGISNGYLSLIERGRRPRPSATILGRLAKCYGVPPDELLARAGYLGETTPSPDEEKQLDHAIQFIRSDPGYQFGARMPGEMTLEVKRFVVRMYEELTDKKLLSGWSE
jgi:transcriptional regulator with XRE-family HTH domain